MSNTKIIIALLGLGIAGYLIYSYYKEQPPSPPTPPERPSPSSKPPEEPGGDGGKVVATLGDYLRGKVRVPGFKQFTTVSISPAILLYHGIAVALGLIDKDADLSAFVEQCVVDWMRWHGVELVVKVYPGMDLFLALEQKFGKSIDKFVSELVKR